jgi:anti-sigma regulatory factor (Ser/Thr protein kinase)
MTARTAVFRSAPGPGAVEAARLFAERTLAGWSLGRVKEPVSAIVTELAANAVMHAGTPFAVELSVDGRVRIEVSDGNAALPVLGVPDLLQEGGRGMVIVQAYATSWGVTSRPGGKTVWAQLDLSESPPWPPPAAARVVP